MNAMLAVAVVILPHYVRLTRAAVITETSKDYVTAARASGATRLRLMGLLFIQSVYFADIPVMAAYLCLIALVFVIINLVVDLLYYAVDPRLRIERSAASH